MADLVRSVAARLMQGQRVVSAAPSSPSPTPRSLPSAHETSASGPSCLQDFSEAPEVPQSALAEQIVYQQTQKRPEQQGSADVRGAETAIPSLRGTPEQLAEARSFSDSATPGRGRPRPGVRARVTNENPSPVLAPRRAQQTNTPGNASSTSSTNGYRAAAPDAFPAHTSLSPTLNGSTRSHSPVPSSFPCLNAESQSITSSPEQCSDPGLVSAPAYAKDGGDLPSVIDNSSTIPPHLRAKHTVQLLTAHSGSATAHKVQEGDRKTGTEDTRRCALPATGHTLTLTPSNAGNPSSVVDAERFTSDSVSQDLTAVVGALHPQDKSRIVLTTPEDRPVAEHSDTNGTLALIRAECHNQVMEFRSLLSKLDGRVTQIETENFALQSKVDSLSQLSERRRFLGTTDGSAPFQLSVRFGDNMRQVQVSGVFKVSDLIRRVRVAFKIPPQDSPRPRILINGKEIGHVITLHEAGVTEISLVEFKHGYEEVDEEL